MLSRRVRDPAGGLIQSIIEILLGERFELGRWGRGGGGCGGAEERGDARREVDNRRAHFLQADLLRLHL